MAVKRSFLLTVTVPPRRCAPRAASNSKALCRPLLNVAERRSCAARRPRRAASRRAPRARLLESEPREPHGELAGALMTPELLEGGDAARGHRGG
jgi:hypothetical protein